MASAVGLNSASGYAQITCDNVASADATATLGTGSNNRINQTFSFVDAAMKDFHLAATDTGALTYGTDLSADPNYPFSTDIDGEARPHGASWDIGFDEYTPPLHLQADSVDQ